MNTQLRVVKPNAELAAYIDLTTIGASFFTYNVEATVKRTLKGGYLLHFTIAKKGK